MLEEEEREEEGGEVELVEAEDEIEETSRRGTDGAESTESIKRGSGSRRGAGPYLKHAEV